MAGAFHGVTEEDAIINVGVSGPGVVKTALEQVRGCLLYTSFAIVTAAMIPVLILSISPAMQASYVAKSLGASGDFLLYGKYLAGWLLPSVLFSVSAGFFFTELAGGAFAILVMGCLLYTSYFRWESII